MRYRHPPSAPQVLVRGDAGRARHGMAGRRNEQRVGFVEAVESLGRAGGERGAVVSDHVNRRSMVTIHALLVKHAARRRSAPGPRTAPAAW